MSEYRIAEWLARAADDPEKAHKEWAKPGVTLLQCGKRFGAIRIPAELLHAGMGGDDFSSDDLRFHIGGPVIHRPNGPYWALIQTHAGRVWDEGDDVPSLDADHYLGVPAPDRTAPPGPHWAVPPRYDGDLCRPETVRRFIAYARQRLTPAEA